MTSLTDSSAQQFSGAVTETACGTTDFTVAPASTINVTMTAETPTNDLMVSLVYNGVVVRNEDTGVGQETFVYSVNDTSGGTYTVKVCKSGAPGDAVPAGRRAVPVRRRLHRRRGDARRIRSRRPARPRTP